MCAEGKRVCVRASHWRVDGGRVNRDGGRIIHGIKRGADKQQVRKGQRGHEITCDALYLHTCTIMFPHCFSMESRRFSGNYK